MSDRSRWLPGGILEGRCAIVTGGGTGLGLEISTRLGELGARVACVSRDTAHHEELLSRAAKHGFEVISRELDVRDYRAVRRVVREIGEEWGRIDILVNNAAGNFVRPALALPPKAFETVIDIALVGVFTMSREVALQMRKTGGAIVNISAPYARDGKPGVVHSVCAKAGVEAMTRSLAAEWAELGIRVNAVSPGPFTSQGAADRLWPSEEIEQAVRGQIPLGRFGKTEEIAELVCLLAGPTAAWMTGTILLADGGWSLPRPLVEGADQRILRRRSQR
ncbi:MAG: SDR family oxidoreductase [Acidobacteriota bacterium]|nr:SDR family oxidoreductase [Acidobacteriota bacterium]MDQ7086963.1 SDR family oxidoreductase [Acidobacteriota bacterium]